MRISDEDGIYLVQPPFIPSPIAITYSSVRQGYCEDVVGRFSAAFVQFIGKLKTPIITKRSSTSKSPRPRSLTPSRRQQPSPTPAPSLSRASSHEEVRLPLTHSSSAPAIPDPLPLAHRHSSLASSRSDASADPSHHDLFFVTPSISHSSSSSAPEPPSPLTPSDSFIEPHIRDKTAPSIASALPSDPLTLRHAENPQCPFKSPIQPLRLARARSQSSDAPISNSSHDPPPSTDPRLGFAGSNNIRLSHLPTAISDSAAGIGLSMLHGFVSGNLDGDHDDDQADDDSDHDLSSRSERERTSLEETVDDFPAPPTQIPTPLSRSTSFVLDARRPTSSISESSDDGDGASFYDNYRYSRLSISSKMSKSSSQTIAIAPPPIPTDPPPQVRHSRDSLSSPPSPLSEPSPSAPETATPSPPPGPPTARQATRRVPPPLTLTSNQLGPEPPDLVTAILSPLLHTNFASPQSSPPVDPTTVSMRSPVNAVFDHRGSGTAPALHQKIESDREISSPLANSLPSTMPEERTFEQFQSVVVKDTKDEVVSPAGDTQPQSPTSPLASSSGSKSEGKKKRGGLAPLVVMNQAPPPPYTPTSPDAFNPSLTFNAMPTPASPCPSSPMVAEPSASPSRASLFLPHPNAPKPSATPQGPLYCRTMPPASLPPPSLLNQTLKSAAQIHIGPNGLPRLNTIYGVTSHDLSASAGPVPIYFSVNPPNDVPANRMRIATPTAQNFPSPLSQAPGERRPKAEGQASTSIVTTRADFSSNAATARRRSRSFSGFDSRMMPGVQPREQGFVSHSPHLPLVSLLKGVLFRSQGKVAARPSTADSISRPNSLAARAAAHTARLHQARQHTPSPLGLPHAMAGRGTSPLAASVPPSPSYPKSSPTSPTLYRTLSPARSEPSLHASHTRSAPERGAPLQSPVKPDAAGSSLVASPPPISGVEDMASSIQISVSESQVGLAARGALGKNEGPFSRQLSSGELRGKTLNGVESSNHGDARSQVISPPPAPASGSLLGRNGSLRSKISLSALRARSSRDDKQQDNGLRESETVQVMDLDFELVRPSLARPPASEDSSANGASSGSEGRPSYLRVDSPATSMTSGTSGPRSPVSPSIPTMPPGGTIRTAARTSAGAVEAHRALELKWITVMASTPPSQARKSKKIRKLLQDGVPASVRYQVWAHLTDSKAKRIEGLYAQLEDRDKVQAHAEIQRDAQLCFPGDPRLSQPNGALVSLLQAYLTMVPDIQYSKGVSLCGS
jgi:TBC1 domain family member 10